MARRDEQYCLAALSTFTSMPMPMPMPMFTFTFTFDIDHQRLFPLFGQVEGGVGVLDRAALWVA